MLQNEDILAPAVKRTIEIINNKNSLAPALETPSVIK